MEQPGLDSARPAGRSSVDLADLAFLAEDRHLVFQYLQQVERCQGGLKIPPFPRKKSVLVSIQSFFKNIGRVFFGELCGFLLFNGLCFKLRVF